MKALLPLTLTAALLGVIGCTSADSDRGRFGRIAEDLDMGGSCFFISSSRHAGTAVDKLLKQHESSVWESPLPQETQFKLQRFISCSELAGRIAGLHEIKGWGGSSKQIACSPKILFRNKFRLLLNEKQKGVLWNLISDKNLSLEGYLRNLPPDTFFAGAVAVTPLNLEKFLNVDPQITETFSGICKIFLNMSPPEMLDTISGIWRLVVICDEENDTESLTGIHIALTLPDKNGKIFAALASRLKKFPHSGVDLKAGTIKLKKMPGKSIIPYICRGNGTISFYTTPRAALRVGDGQSFPQQPSFIKQLTPFTSLDGVGIFYSRSTGTGKDFSKSIDMSTRQPSLAVLKKKQDGFLLEDISACDFNQYAVFSFGVLPLKLVFESLAAPPAGNQAPRSVQSPSKNVRKPSAGPQNSRSKKVPAVRTLNKDQSCLAAIRLAGQKLLKDASVSGKWSSPGIAGLRSLVGKKVLNAEMLKCPAVKGTAGSVPGLSYANCHYLYFGKPGKKSPKTPVLMELPFLHKSSFSIFYADGTVEKVQLDGRRNVRRAISFLHTVHSYEEEEFIRLIQLASEFDKILER